MKSHKKINGGGESKIETNWLTTFNDLVTNLMVFFVLLFSLSTIDTKRISTFSQALQSGLGVLKEGRRTSVAVVDQRLKFGIEKGTTRSDPEGREAGEEEEPNTAAEETPVETIEIGETEELLERIETIEGLKGEIVESGLLITLPDGILFSPGSAEITPEGLLVLGRISEILLKREDRIRVEGHTDNKPISTRRFPTNWELSVARAVNVLKYLRAEGGIAPQRLSAVGYGESRPVFPNDTPEHRARNRRVEIVLVMREK